MKRKMVIVLAAIFVLCIASTALAAVTTYANSYGRWVISPSSVRTSNNVKKTVSGTAMVGATQQSPSGEVVWYGLRNSSGTTRVHKNAIGKSSCPTSDFGIAYKSGYGTINTRYCLAVQNDSESTQDVTVAGTWRP